MSGWSANFNHRALQVSLHGSGTDADRSAVCPDTNVSDALLLAQRINRRRCQPESFSDLTHTQPRRIHELLLNKIKRLHVRGFFVCGPTGTHVSYRRLVFHRLYCYYKR